MKNSETNRNVTVGMALAYVGCVVPNTAAFHNSVFSPAGNMWQNNLLASLARNGVEPSLILANRPQPSWPSCPRIFVKKERAVLQPRMEAELAPSINITPLKQLFAGVYAFFRLLIWALKYRKHKRVIYTYNLSFPPAPFIYAAARLTNSTLAASVNDINEPGQTVPATLLQRLDYWLHQKFLPRYDGLVAVSQAIISDFAPHAPHILVEGGIVPESFQEAAPKAPSEVFTVVWAGSLDAANGIELLLEAVRELKDPGFKFVIAGAGSLADRVRAAAGADPRIKYAGLIAWNKVLELYRNADLLLNLRITAALRTRYFFPSKFTEMAASGTPVLSTCTGHIATEFGDKVYLLREETPEHLRNLLLEIKQTPAPDRHAMGERARRYMLTHKTWDAQARRIAQFLSSISHDETLQAREELAA